MKKVTAFIVNKRNIILIFFIILTGVCAILSNHVTINHDMAKYLPNTSSVRKGMDIMEDEFQEQKSSSLNVMFQGLKKSEKKKICQELENIKGVSSVTYDIDSSDYNKKGYTLYIVNISDTEDSKISSSVYHKIEDKYEDDDIAMSGAVAEKNKTVLPAWIMIVAVGICFIILIIMCESYIEPVLFLITIGIAVMLNNGTNIIFSSVSNITSSICAILQMALSMDYSIMLMNRYRQEKKHENDKVIAMKKALYKAFLAISSSSLTTIVGLLALVFMSFTIGKDLGFVLAKGVLLSLVSIFFCLPALILLFDKVITKTKKKSPNFNLKKLGSFSYKIRPISIFLLVGLFVVSFILKGNLRILYTDKEQDEIAKVFPENNQMAIIYNNKDEEFVSKYCKNLDKYTKVDQVLCYGNTIGQKLTYQEFNEKLDDLNTDMNIDNELLRILYYDYYNGNKKTKMTFNDFVAFIQNDVLSNDIFSKNIDSDMKDNINKLNYFTTIESINMKRNTEELSKILGIDQNSLEQLLIYYNSKNINTKMSLNTFVRFMNNDVLTNPTYASNIDSNAKNSLKVLEKYINKSNITKNMTSNELANFYGIDEALVNQLYLYYYSIHGVDEKLTLYDFSKFTIQSVMINEEYASSISEEMRTSLQLLNTFSNQNVIMRDMTTLEISNLFGIDENLVKQIFLLEYGTKDNGTRMSLGNFINSVSYLKNNTTYLDNYDISSLLALASDTTIMNNPNSYTAEEVSNMLGISQAEVYNLYALIDLVNGNTANWKLSPNNFVNLIINNSNREEIRNNIDSTALQKLQFLKKIMSSSIENKSYNYSELATFIGSDEASIKNIYALYCSMNQQLTMTPKTFVDFILINKDNSLLSGKLDSSTIKSLEYVQKLMNSSLNNTNYSTLELANLLQMNKDDLKLIYSLYHEKYENSESISLKELVSFILTDVSQNEKYASSFNSSSLKQLETIDNIMKGVEGNKKYSSSEIYSLLNSFTSSLDKNMIELLYLYYGSNHFYNNKWTLTIEELITYLKQDIIKDKRFSKFISENMKNSIKDGYKIIHKAKDNLIGSKYSRIVLNTKLDQESKETFNFIKKLEKIFGKNNHEAYIVGNSPMAYEMSNSFNDELNYITILTMIAIFVVVAITFKSISIPAILVLIIQTAVYITMGYLSLLGGEVYFIALLIVQSILMGATIDYAILYTSYYKESRNNLDVKESIINAYNKSIHTILTSSSILIIVTFIVGNFATAIAAKICKTISQGTLCSLILILFLLPAVLALCDKFIIRKKQKH